MNIFISPYNFTDPSLLVPPRDDIKIKVSDVSKAFEQSDEISRFVNNTHLKFRAKFMIKIFNFHRVVDDLNSRDVKQTLLGTVERCTVN